MQSNGKPQRNDELVLSRRELVLDALDEFERPLTRFAERMFGGDHELARDVVQHSFLKLCQQPVTDWIDHVGPWLYRVCRNRIVDEMRSRGRQAVTDMQAFDTEDRKSSDPAETAEQSDFLRHLATLINRLKGAERDVVELWSHGFDHKEISQILDRKPATVRVNLHRAIKQLKRNPDLTYWLQRASGQVVEPDVETTSNRQTVKTSATTGETR